MRGILLAIADFPHRLRRITRAGKYRPEIDGLRFIAIGLVIVGHVASRVERAQNALFAPTPSLSLTYKLLEIQGAGVLLFFSISGFIIASQFLRNAAHPFSSGFLAPYYLRRITRIEPPYFLLLVGTFLFLVWTGYFPTDAPLFKGESSLTGSLIASLLYAHDYVFGHLPRLFPPGWSLEVEVQFYVFAPLFFYLYFVRVPPNRKFLVGLVVVAATILLSGWVGSLGNRNIQLTLLRYFPYFWTGIVLSATANSWERWSIRVPSLVTSTAAWIALPIFVWLNTVPLKSRVMVDIAYAGSIATIAIMFFGALGAGSFRGFCRISWLSLLGGACYSIYLSHLQISQVITHLMFRIGWFSRLSWPVQLGVGYVVEVPIIFALGLAFYALIERPFMLPNWPKAMWNRIKNPLRTAA